MRYMIFPMPGSLLSRAMGNRKGASFSRSVTNPRLGGFGWAIRFFSRFSDRSKCLFSFSFIIEYYCKKRNYVFYFVIL